MDAAAWLAWFAEREQAWIGASVAFRVGVAAKIEVERAPKDIRKDWEHAVVLDMKVVDLDGEMPNAPHRVALAALAAGWSGRGVRAVAAVPGKGVVESWSVRAARHDERVWASWWNGAFDAGQYYRRGAGEAMEVLAGDRMGQWNPGAVLAVESMTVPQIKTLAAERGIKIPSKYAKAAVIEHVKALGLASAAVPKPRRGVLDAIEGLHLIGA
jgi:hypothetical protein